MEVRGILGGQPRSWGPQRPARVSEGRNAWCHGDDADAWASPLQPAGPRNLQFGAAPRVSPGAVPTNDPKGGPDNLGADPPMCSGSREAEVTLSSGPHFLGGSGAFWPLLLASGGSRWGLACSPGPLPSASCLQVFPCLPPVRTAGRG